MTTTSVRRGLLSTLAAEPQCEVVGEARTGREAVEQARKHKPHLVIMDILMPELNGLEATRQILKELPSTAVLVLSVYESEQMTRELLSAGVRGYVMKSDASRDLIAAVHALRRHKHFFTRKVSTQVLDGYLYGAKPKDQFPDGTGALTPRECEVVQLLAEGKSNKDVSQALGISVKTAETHRARIMAKLHLRSVTELVRYAVRNKIVEP